MMKTKSIYITLVLALMGMNTVFAQTKTKEFKVYGNCGMCEKRIEKAAKSVEGVSEADWNQKDKMLEVSFDDSETDVHQVHMAVAKAGHDTKMHKASDETYENLPTCCQYDRNESKEHEMGHEGHQHE